MTNSTSIPTATLPLAPGRWELDHGHSTVGFTVRHLGVSKVRGRFDRFDADVVIGADLASTTLTATVDLASVETGQAQRDEHLLAPDLLDVAVRPTMAFRSTALRPEGDGWVVDGALTIGEVTRPFALTVELGGIGDYLDGSRHAGFEARGELRRSDFGIGPSYPSAMLGDVVKVELDLQLVEPRSA